MTMHIFALIVCGWRLMMDFETLMNTIQRETTPLVKLWMIWMVFIFLLSLVFITKYKTAHWALAVIIGTGALATIVWITTKNVHLFALPHLILWTPLEVYLWTNALSPLTYGAQPMPQNLYAQAHGLWVILLFVTILISLIFDVRDVFLVITGGK